jgi:hypothetical protein
MGHLKPGLTEKQAQIDLDFRRLARAAPALAARLDAAAQRHLEAALPHLSEDYMGEHWLSTFALLALDDV